MEMPSDDASSQLLLETYGEFLIPAARAEPLAADITAEFSARQDALRTAFEARVAAERALTGAEALEGRAEADVEDKLRILELLVLGASGKKRDQEPYVTVYPRYLTGALKPVGAAQAAEGHRIADLVAPTSGDPLPGLPPDAGRVGVELRELCVVLQERVTATDRAAAAVVAAYASELSERRRWRAQYRKSHGLFTALFPNDRRKADSFFRKSKPRKKAKTEG